MSLSHTPDNITSLKANEWIVVGTNKFGRHGGGAANFAMEHFGLIWGCGEGMSGKSYALPTMEGLAAFHRAANRFIRFARYNPDKRFFLTKVGCGIAGYEETVVKSLFLETPPNVIKPEGWY